MGVSVKTFNILKAIGTDTKIDYDLSFLKGQDGTSAYEYAQRSGYNENQLTFYDNLAKAINAYPVGAIYISGNNTSPAYYFGGTWEKIEDKFLLAAGSTYTAGDTGGAETVTLTTATMPKHRHQITSGTSTTLGSKANMIHKHGNGNTY